MRPEPSVLGSPDIAPALAAELQPDKTGIRADEPTSIEVEGAEVILEIDVEPLASSGTSLVDSEGDQFGPDPASPHSRRHDGVQDERVDGPVPGDVNEAHEVVSLASTDPAQAMSVHLTPPVVFGGLVIEAFPM